MDFRIPFDVLAGVASVLIAFYAYRARKRNDLPLPPGPKGYPIIGNLLDLPLQGTWVKFHELSKQFESDIIHVSLAGQSVIVLDSPEAVTELLERRSSLYSDRPGLPMVNDLMGWDFVFPIAPYGNKWRIQRKLMHRLFHPGVVYKFKPHALKTARSVLRRFLDKPGDIVGSFYHMAGEVTLKVAYGLDVQPENDPHVELSEESVHMLAEAIKPGANMVDIFPILKYVPEWMPGAGFHARAKKGRELAQRVIELPFREATRLIASGNYTPSFVSHSTSDIDDEPAEDPALREYLVKATAASMYLAGADTMSGMLGFCFAALADQPETLTRAQQEIDAVVPFGELPTFDDEGKLPFVTAIIMESLRWKEILPLSLPHSLMEEDTYKGYRLPKGSIVMGNSWAMLHDEAVYPDPFSFKPERFLREDGQINEEVRHPSFAAFGYGRRICPGRYLAIPIVWITVASVLAAFDIKKSDREKQPNEGEPGESILEGVLRHPKPFPCSIKPRSAKHEQAIRATVNDEYF